MTFYGVINDSFYPGNPVGSGYTFTFNEIVAGGVPEPTSWPMLIAGFGIVGAAQRRRRTGLQSIVAYRTCYRRYVTGGSWWWNYPFFDPSVGEYIAEGDKERDRLMTSFATPTGNVPGAPAAVAG